jgi:multimeric flavodoxin WrbA
MARLKGLFLVGTLKSKSDVSNTRLLSEFLAKHIESKEVESDIVHLADYNILPGSIPISTKMTSGL